MSEEKLSTNIGETSDVCQSKDDTKQSILSIELIDEIVNSTCKSTI